MQPFSEDESGDRAIRSFGLVGPIDVAVQV